RRVRQPAGASPSPGHGAGAFPTILIHDSGGMMRLSRFLQAAALSLGLLPAAAPAVEPIPIDALARLPNFDFASMSSDGKTIVAIVAMPGSDNKETGVATWDLDYLDRGPIITPSGDPTKRLAPSPLKACRML